MAITFVDIAMNKLYIFTLSIADYTATVLSDISACFPFN